MKRYNGVPVAKQRLRLEVLAAAGAPKVLEVFAGQGEMYRAAWGGCFGLTMDKDAALVAAASRERPGWFCVCGDSEKMLAGGIGAHVPWDVVDFDAFGSPWPFVQAWLTSRREFAEVTHAVLTDGYASQKGLAPRCRALFPGQGATRGPMPRGHYEAVVAAKLGEWAASAGLVVESSRFVDALRKYKCNSKPMRLHHLVIRKDGASPR